MATDDTRDETEVTDQARRRLLKLAVYVPPAILGVVAASQAACQAQSCGPTNCPPENGGTPCPPTGGQGCPPAN
jgi:hypothetical protein